MWIKKIGSLCKPDHIYDITKKLRDTVHRVNDVGQPVGNALVNGISKHSIPDSPESVNKNLPETDRSFIREAYIIFMDMPAAYP